ncbi:MAG: adenylate/guanylate cyclase domain-containing protein, partial [Gemmatimonadetes bacterium]|nr:adenylate/guanylate cyclase domain-containing protein [Gemmatimonadota bacterium]
MEERRLAVIVFTDIVGYSRMVQTDERLALELLEEHNRIVGQLIDGKGGQTLKTAGDSFLASFESAGAAVAASAGIQQALAVRNEGLPEERQLHVRIGIHAGDVVFTDDPAGGRDVLGDGVNVASRVEAQASGGEVFVSHDVFSITYDRVPFGYRDVGVRDLKNISRPIHIYELLWDPARQSEADAQPPRSPAAAGSNKGARIGYAVGAIAVIAAAAVIIFHSNPGTEDPLAQRPAMAVMGIEDRTGDDDAYLGRIAHDAIEQYFYEFQPIRLVSPLRVARARRELGLDDGASDLASIASLTSAIDIRLAATGQLTRRGEQLHFTASLYDLAGEGKVLVRRSWTADNDNQLLALVDSACTAFQQRLADVFEFEMDDFRIARAGDMTTHNLDAYAHFVRGHDLAYAGFLEEGASELIKATQIDTGFALAYSITACALSFDKQDSLSGHYFNLALQHADDRLVE